MQVVASDDFVDTTINELLQAKITDARVLIEQQYNSQSKVDRLKSRREEIKSIVLEKFDTKYSSFRVLVQYNDGKSEPFSGRYISYVMAPVAAKYIKYAEIIQSDDITTEKTLLANIKKGFATEESEVVGMQAKKYIAVGKMFKLNEMSSPPVIKNNDPVNIVYSSGSISLKTVGISMGVGAVGDMIKVKNSSSGAVLLGQIINKNTVQVGGNNE
ncbi:MAG: flagellar basal body P-ring formation chaperone FlgA [Rickettsiaceae bacterium]|nr:flagellar basal body P-ring formation chaperone FlgA [Rickettsiaceae bacterium]